jgi:hypothetical protein
LFELAASVVVIAAYSLFVLCVAFVAGTTLKELSSADVAPPSQH